MRIRKPLQVLLQFKMLKEKWKRAWAWINQVEDYSPDVFVKSQWQLGETSTIYLIYRWMLAGTFVCGLFASVLDLGRDPVPGAAARAAPAPSHDIQHYFKWPIYLTNWGYTACTVQAIMATAHVTKHYARMRINPGAGMEKMKTSYKLYWVIHSVAVICSVVITTIYWSAVYRPETDSIDVVNLTVHVFNSVLMVLDLWVVAHPFKLFHFYWAFILGAVYSVFSYIYFLAGGTNRRGNPFIYLILNWRRPVNALLAISCTVLFEALVTVIAWMMFIVRRRLANLFHRKMAARRMANSGQATDQGPRIV
ncbi:protein rolling stone-like isoform X2 [Nilaparvata lugens]|uniref:protein rolling stone isoform X2 n=1 Tax=Nilaparvata lugens TaxID=108931 RepID=UPI00193C9143|nr:protein rolling stone isoform X2 [Nilaparvata lugens]XP_039276581.1 protein rolling stone-like isoform X2 [Nilaparvata lugens]